MSENKHFVYDSITLDPAKTTAYNHDIFGPVTVFKDVVIAREIIHQYDDGWAYKPAKELENAYWTADGRWAKAGSHPSSTIIASKDDINGRTINPKFTKSLFDPKTRRPNNRGIVADLEVFDKRIAPDILEEMKTGVKTDVSIGFFFDRDDTPGTIDEDGHPLNGSEYDYVQRNFIIDHTAFALEKGMGRCPLPYCGIGADKNKEEEEDKEVTGDPFGEWESMEECIRDLMRPKSEGGQGYTREQAGGTCAEIEKKSKAKHKSDVEESINMMKLEELKTKLAEILRAFDDLVEEEYQGNLTPITESERAKRYFNISDEDWDALTEREKESYIGRLPPKKMGPEEGKGDESEENQQDSPPEDTEEDTKEDTEEEDTTPPKKKPAVDMSEVERAKKLFNL